MLGGTGAAELYAGFSAPVFAFSYLVVLTLVALPLAILLGYRLGRIEYRRRGYDKMPPQQVPGSTSLGAILALLGLLLGFAFSTSLGWREARQSALVEEAAAIGTAFLIADLLEDPGRTDLQTRILVYAKTRVAGADDIRTLEAWRAFLGRTFEAQAEIWPATLRAIGGASDPVRTTVAQSVTAMMDAHTRRIAAAAEQIPPPAKLMIFLVAVVAMLITGNRTALQGRTLTWRSFTFAALLSVIMIVIFDLDRTLEGAMRTNTDTLVATIGDMEKALNSGGD